MFNLVTQRHLGFVHESIHEITVIKSKYSVVELIFSSKLGTSMTTIGWFQMSISCIPTNIYFKFLFLIIFTTIFYGSLFGMNRDLIMITSARSGGPKVKYHFLLRVVIPNTELLQRRQRKRRDQNSLLHSSASEAKSPKEAKRSKIA